MNEQVLQLLFTICILISANINTLLVSQFNCDAPPAPPAILVGQNYLLVHNKVGGPGPFFPEKVQAWRKFKLFWTLETVVFHILAEKGCLHYHSPRHCKTWRIFLGNSSPPLHPMFSSWPPFLTPYFFKPPLPPDKKTNGSLLKRFALNTNDPRGTLARQHHTIFTCSNLKITRPSPGYKSFTSKGRHLKEVTDRLDYENECEHET